MYNKSNKEIIKVKSGGKGSESPESEYQCRKFDFLSGIEYLRLDV
jgi:hypothetical protein